jgi:hypothetical protein
VGVSTFRAGAYMLASDWGMRRAACEGVRGEGWAFGKHIFAALIRLAVRLKAYWNPGSCACMARGHQRFCFICVLGNVQNIKGIVSFSPSYAHVSYHLYLLRPVPSRCRFKLYACGHAFPQQRKTTCRLDRGLISQHACVGVFRFPRPAPDCPTPECGA